MIKITVISIFFPPERGAAPSRIFNMCKALQARGCDVEVITAMPNYPTGKIFKPYQGKLAVKEVEDTVKCRRYWLYPSNSNNPIVRVFGMFSFALSIFMSIPYLIRRRSDIVIVQSPPLLVALSSAILGLLVRAKVISNISDVWPLTALELGVVKKGIGYSFFEWVEKWLYQMSSGFLAQSGQTIEHLKKFSNKPMFLYSNLSQTSKFELVEYKQEQLKIVYAGLLGLAQGVLSICKEIDFKRMGVEFHIYGNGVEKEKILEFVKENSDRNVFVHESVPKSDMPKLLSSFHATVIPLQKPIYGALPSKIFMAISSGLPVLFCGEGEGRDMIEKYNIGWVCNAGDNVALAGNIERMVNNANEYNEKRKQILHARSSYFDYNVLQDNLLHFLESQ